MLRSLIVSAPTEPAAPAGSSSGLPDGASSTARLARSAGVIGTATLTSRVLGLLRDQVLAWLFGAGNAMDAFYVAYRIPNLLRDLFAEGAMSAAFVPTFTRRLRQLGKPAAWQLGNQLINALIVVTGTLVVLGVIYARPLTELIAGDYAAVPGKLELTATLTRILLPLLSLVAVAAALMGMLNSLNRFFIPALSPAMFNVGVILSAFVLVPFAPALGLHPIVAIAVGMLLGGLGQIALQLPPLRREGFRYRPHLNPADPGLREMLRLMGPGTLAGAAMQINLLVNTILAAGEGTGAVSWLSYAFRLMYVPIGLFGVSLATATLPAVARHAAGGDLSGMRQTIADALRMMLMLIVPALVGLIVLAEPIVRVIFERGSFAPADTTATAAALAFYAPGLLGYSAVRIVVPCFYALRDSVTPTLVSMAAVVLNLVLNLLLVQWMGYRGLALGTSIAAIANAALLYYLLQRRIGGIGGSRLLAAFWKITVAAGLMGGAVVAVQGGLQAAWPQPGLLPALVRLAASIGAGLAVVAVTARVLGIEDWEAALRRIGAQFRRLRGGGER